MAKFLDLINSLGTGEDGVSPLYPDTFVSDLGSAYDDDISVYAAKVGVVEADLANALADIATLKAHNYDLLMQIPTTNPETETETDDDDDEISSVDDLFKEGE